MSSYGEGHVGHDALPSTWSSLLLLSQTLNEKLLLLVSDKQVILSVLDTIRVLLVLPLRLILLFHLPQGHVLGIDA